jgi:hypothetical protein
MPEPGGVGAGGKEAPGLPNDEGSEAPGGDEAHELVSITVKTMVTAKRMKNNLLLNNIPIRIDESPFSRSLNKYTEITGNHHIHRFSDNHAASP